MPQQRLDLEMTLLLFLKGGLNITLKLIYMLEKICVQVSKES